MNNRNRLNTLLTGTPKDVRQVLASKPPINATLQVVAPEGYEPLPTDEVALYGTGERMTAAEWQKLNTNANTLPVLSTLSVEGAVFMNPKKPHHATD